MNNSNFRGSILIVDDVPANIAVLLDFLTESGFRTFVAENGDSAIEQIQYSAPDLILLDIMMPGLDGFETCRLIKQNPVTNDIPVIFMSSLSETVDKVRGFEVGAVDYITKPIQHEEVLARVNTHITLKNLREEMQKTNEKLEQRVSERTNELRNALEEVNRLKKQLEEENIYLKEEIKSDHNFDEIISNDPEIIKILNKITQVAETDSTVLILGETGTGKELFSRAVHSSSKRKNKSLVKVNCASLPANLIESELFGHEKGAFTGALAKKIGRFELADGGTIFLDEIGDLPLELQSKLLRVLQEGEFERLGNPHTVKVDVRVVAATNRDLKKEIEEGKFRQDLYYRLNVFPVTIPPLNRRINDIPLLARHFVDKYSRKTGRIINSIPNSVINSLKSYNWPGNVRELENVIERAVILSSDGKLQIDDSIPAISGRPVTRPEGIKLKDVEKAHILSILEESNWIIDGPRGTAKKLGLAPSTLRDKMKRLGIMRPK